MTVHASGHALQEALLDSGRPAFAHAQEPTPEQARLENAQRAVLNILEDFAAEKNDLERGLRATLNIFEDFVAEKSQLEASQRSVLNILDDFSEEKVRLEGAQSAALNILDDFSVEKGQLQESQRATLNILEDFDTVNVNVGLANQQLAREVEERKRVEEKIKRVNTDLVAANKELEAFSYSVSHDLRGPLRSIDGFSQAVLEDYLDKLDARGQDYLRHVRAATQRMGALIDDLLNLSRMTRAEIHVETLDISALARSIADEIQKTQPELRAEFRIENGLETKGDPRLLRIVLENLLGNACKFSSKRLSPVIEFGKVHCNGTLAYFIRDNGAGFDPAYAGRLFGAFQRLHTTAEFPGTGVGLATVQRIIHRHGGRIWAAGAVDKGATFHFTLTEPPQ
jgi:signal transduction histidine kinase